MFRLRIAWAPAHTRHLMICLAALCAMGAMVPSAVFAASPSTEFTVPAGSHRVTVVAREYAFEMPATIPAGLTTFVLKDEGKQDHHMEVARLEHGTTIADVMAMFAHPGTPPPAGFIPVGGPNTPMPGEESNMTLVLTPGRYVVFCLIPAPDGKLHVMHGMIRPFTVTPSTAKPATLPKADMTITLRDYAFDFSRPITAGRHVIEVVNDSPQPHEMVINRFAQNEGNRALEQWALHPDGKPAPGYALGGVTNLAPGEHVVIEVDFTPGKYGLVCFAPDAADGKPHFMHGMQREFVVR